MNKAQVLLQFSFKSRGKMLDGEIYLKSENNEKENVRELLINMLSLRKLVQIQLNGFSFHMFSLGFSLSS